MPSKPISTLLFFCLVGGALNSAPTDVSGNDNRVRFLGAQSCASTSCHGGAHTNRNQYLIWSQRDFHSRAYTTLLNRRSQVIASTLGIDAVKSQRCTDCHAPLAALPKDMLAPDALPAAGVSCDNCHGPAEPWLRSHTRPDYTYADRIAAGMRDLKSLYGRANACVPCHQHLDADILGAGHPELIFELDGQSVSQPKHWRESSKWRGAKAWLIGQAVALREQSWHLANAKSADQKHIATWRALVWLLQTVHQSAWPDVKEIGSTGSPEEAERAKDLSDKLARVVDEQDWTSNTTWMCLQRLAGTHEDFRKTELPTEVHAHRAERLVLALDRLCADLQQESPAINLQLNRLFAAVQSRPDFQPVAFAELLEAFEAKIRPLERDKP